MASFSLIITTTYSSVIIAVDNILIKLHNYYFPLPNLTYRLIHVHYDPMTNKLQ